MITIRLGDVTSRWDEQIYIIILIKTFSTKNFRQIIFTFSVHFDHPCRMKKPAPSMLFALYYSQ